MADTAEPGPIHQCPPGITALMPCCGQHIYAAPRTDRITLNPALVTCPGQPATVLPLPAPKEAASG